MSELFRALLIETCNTCTRRCWFCKFGQLRQDNAVSQMDWDTIIRILENLRDLHYSGRISWYNINEPLLDQRIEEIIKMTREYCPQAFISLATNGDLLDATLYRNLKAGGLDALGVSVYDDRVYDKVRTLADPQLVLMDMRSRDHSELENRAGNIRCKSPLFERDRIRFQDKTCVRPFTMMVINPRGQAVLCCDDLYGDVVMGDVHSHRLEQIWNSERFEHYRTVLSSRGRRSLPLCRDCSYSGEGFRPFFPYYNENPAPGLRDRLRSQLGRIRRNLFSGSD